MSAATGSETPKIKRGETYFNGRTASTSEGGDLEGREGQFTDIDYSTSGSAKSLRTNSTVYARLMRNVSGSTLLPKRVVKCYLSGSGNEILGQFDGYAETPGTHVIAGVIDEWLPSTGVVANDLCWVVFRGPSKCTTGAAGDTNIAIGNRVIPTTDGKVIDQDVSQDDASIFEQIHGEVGKAIRSVNATSTDFLVDVNISK